MAEKLLSPSNGLSKSKLEKATAGTGDVLEGKTFYAGDGTLKTGTIVNRGIEQVGGGFAQDENYFYIQPIPAGYYYNDHPVNASWNPRVKVVKSEAYNLLGGDHSYWGATINPGESVSIPAGYHNGMGTVTANSIQSQLKTASFSLQLSSNGGGYGETKETTWNPGGTVIGISQCYIYTDTQSGLNQTDYSMCEVSNGSVRFVNRFTHRGGVSRATGIALYI